MISRKLRTRLAFALTAVVSVISYQNCGGGFSAVEMEGSSYLWQNSGYDINPATKFTCTTPQSRGIAQKNFRRLTKSELSLTVRDLFGASVSGNTSVSTAIAAFPSESPGDLVHELVNTHSFNQVNGLYQLADAISTQVFASAATRDAFFGACASAPNEACVRTFLSKNGARLVRRVLTQARADEFVAAYNTLGGGVDGLRTLLTFMLISPEFVFHFETGREPASTNAGRMALNDFEVANRISYAITGTLPDTQLFDAAVAGALKTIPQVRAHTERLAKSAAARTHFESVLDSWLETNTYQDPNNVLAGKAGIASVTGFAAEARRELMDYATYMVFDQNASLPDLLSAKIGFPRSDRMAKIYGSQLAANTSQPVGLPNGHGGLLLRAGVLVKGTMAPSPILRGVAVRKRFLCETLPSPDFSIVSTRTQSLDQQDTSLLSNREVADVITSDNACKGCHTLINPIGFTMEKFDSLGMARSIENVYNPDGTVRVTHPIDTSVSNPNLEANGPKSLRGADDLMLAIAGSSKARSCAAERLFSATRIRPMESGDSCAASEIEKRLLEGASVKEAWILSVANEDVLWRKVAQ